MKRVVGISLGAGAQDFAFRGRFLGRQLDVKRIGTDHSVPKAEKLLRHWEYHADAIGIGVAREAYLVGGQKFVDAEGARLMAAVTRVPATTGARLHDILQEWSLRHVQNKLGDYFNNAKVLFFSGVSHYKLAQAFAEYTPNLEFADALLELGVPKMLGSLEALELFASGAHYVTDRVPDLVTDNRAVREWQRFVLRRAMRDATVIVGPVHELDAFGREDIHHLAGAAGEPSGLDRLRDAPAGRRIQRLSGFQQFAAFACHHRDNIPAAGGHKPDIHALSWRENGRLGRFKLRRRSGSDGRRD